MKNLPKVAVFGGGSWATALVKMLCENLDEVGWYMRNEVAIEYIKENEHNPNYLPSAEFDVSKLKLSNDLNEIAEYADYLIMVIPSAFVKTALDELTVDVSQKVIFSAIKGIVSEVGMIPGEYFHEYLNVPYDNIGVITGPCHAEEVAMERLSYLTIACHDINKAAVLSDCLRSHYIRTKNSDDIVGTEYAAVAKNIYAIAAGIAHGLGYGDNFQAVLMSNAIREMKRFIKKAHKMKRNINNSAYLGDLLVTGYSTFSRNRMFGNMIGKGYTVKSAMMEMNMVAEGYYATKSAYEYKLTQKTNTPILDAVHAILYQNKNPKTIFKNLTEKLD